MCKLDQDYERLIKGIILSTSSFNAASYPVHEELLFNTRFYSALVLGELHKKTIAFPEMEYYSTYHSVALKLSQETEWRKTCIEKLDGAGEKMFSGHEPDIEELLSKFKPLSQKAKEDVLGTLAVNLEYTLNDSPRTTAENLGRQLIELLARHEEYLEAKKRMN